MKRTAVVLWMLGVVAVAGVAWAQTVQPVRIVGQTVDVKVTTDAGLPVAVQGSVEVFGGVDVKTVGEALRVVGEDGGVVVVGTGASPLDTRTTLTPETTASLAAANQTPSRDVVGRGWTTVSADGGTLIPALPDGGYNPASGRTVIILSNVGNKEAGCRPDFGDGGLPNLPNAITSITTDYLAVGGVLSYEVDAGVIIRCTTSASTTVISTSEEAPKP